MTIVDSILVSEGEYDLLFKRGMTNAAVRKRLSRNLRCVRRLRGLTIRQVAEAAGMHETDLNKIERGHKWPARPKYQELLMACKALRVDLYSILHRDLLQAALDAVGVQKE